MNKKLYIFLLVCLSYASLHSMQDNLTLSFLGRLPANGPLTWHKTKSDCLMIVSFDPEETSEKMIRIFDMSIDRGVGTSINEKACFLSMYTSNMSDVKWHPQNSNSIALLSADRKTITVTKLNKSIYDTEEIFTHTGETEICSVAWHPVGEEIIALGLENGNIEIWNINNKTKPRHTVQAHKNPVHILEWQTKAPFALASAAKESTVLNVWSIGLSDRQIKKTVKLHGSPTNQNQRIQSFFNITDIYWHPTQDKLIFTTYEKIIGLKITGITTSETYDLNEKTQTRRQLPPFHAQMSYGLNHADPSTIAYASTMMDLILVKSPDKTINIPVLHEVGNNYGYVQKSFRPAFDWNPKYSDLFAYSTEDKIVRIINIKDPEKILKSIDFCDSLGVAKVAWNITGDKLAISSLRGDYGGALMTEVFQIKL